MGPLQKHIKASATTHGFFGNYELAVQQQQAQVIATSLAQIPAAVHAFCKPMVSYSYHSIMTLHSKHWWRLFKPLLGLRLTSVAPSSSFEGCSGTVCSLCTQFMYAAYKRSTWASSQLEGVAIAVCDLPSMPIRHQTQLVIAQQKGPYIAGPVKCRITPQLLHTVLWCNSMDYLLCVCYCICCQAHKP